MSDRFPSFQKHLEDISNRAAAMRRTLVDPFRDNNGKLTPPASAKEAKDRAQILESHVGDSIYATVNHGGMIAAVHSRALQGYEQMYGRMPSDDLLASCHKAIENAINICNGKSSAGGVFEAADMSTTEGIILREKLISLILPVHLQSITSNMVTYIPGEFNQSEFFRVKRVAGTTFGTLQRGDIIDHDYDGLYSVMDQRVVLGQADGVTTAFSFNSASINGTAYPFKERRCRIWVGRKQVAEDNGNGSLSGKYDVGGTTVLVSGSVDYVHGTATVSFSVAPATGVDLHIGFDVHIEQQSDLIPRIDHQMFSRVLYPHESAITGNATIQAIWTLRRELGQDIDSLTMQGLRNMLAADKDKKHLHDMMFHAQDSVDWTYVGDPTLTMKEHFETLNAALLEVDSKLMCGNGVSGLTGIVAGVQATNIFRYLPAPYFQPAPGFRSTAQPHYVGRAFGQWDLYCNPQMDGYKALCFARGPEHGQTAYVAGDAVPAITFRHPVLGDLTQRATMWELAYRDMQPFDGEKYLCVLNFVADDAAPAPVTPPAGGTGAGTGTEPGAGTGSGS